MSNKDRLKRLNKSIDELKEAKDTLLYGARLSLNSGEYSHAKWNCEKLVTLQEEIAEFEETVKELEESGE